MAGKFLILAGLALIVVGAMASAGWLSWMGKLPGDIAIKKENFSFYFPVVTGLVLSAALTLLFWFFGRR